MAEDNFSRAKELLLGAVDTVISIAAKERVSLEQGQSSGSRSSLQPPWAESSSSSHVSRMLEPQRSTNGGASSSLQSVQPSRTLESQSSMTAGFMEHKRLFGYQPSKGTKGKGSAIGKKGKGRSVRQQKRQATWRKDCICLGDSEQQWKPSPEEKIELARMGLGLSQAEFPHPRGRRCLVYVENCIASSTRASYASAQR